tara:strand:- start:1502 stop:2800 length:1299 start_codon:yes stop_codon:yes gene_type:complete
MYTQHNISGQSAYSLLKDLFPIARSLTGDGVRKTLNRIKKIIPIDIKEVSSGYKAYDWIVPDEWNIKDAYVLDPDGVKIIDFHCNNLHVLYYSTPFNGVVTLDELKDHAYTLSDKPSLIPFVASYYKKQWGICMSHDQLVSLKEGDYTVVIDSTLKPGFLTYGEIIIEGQSKKEIFLSTYICHPSLANDNLSGVVVTTALSEYILSLKNRYYSYRIIFIPETIGALVYMSKNLPIMKQNIIAGYTVTCVGDPGNFSYLMSKYENEYVDRVTLHVLNSIKSKYHTYNFLHRGSDERQYSSPGADLPIGSLMRSKYHVYPEYHTSADNLDYVTPEGLNGSIELYQKCIDVYEINKYYKAVVIGEPKLSSRNLYPDTFQEKQLPDVNIIVDFLTYADGSNDLIDIAEKLRVPIWDLYDVVATLLKVQLIVECKRV